MPFTSCDVLDVFAFKNEGEITMPDSNTTVLTFLWRLILGPNLIRLRREMRDMAVRHARERAALDAWVIECQHYWEVGDEIDVY